jgi:hypothetical protein
MKKNYLSQLQSRAPRVLVGTGFCLLLAAPGLVQAQMSPAYTLPLNGTTQYAGVANASVLEFTTGTVEMWVKPNWVAGTLGGANPSFAAERTPSGGATRFSLHITDGLNAIGIWNNGAWLTVPFAFTQGQWYHVAAVMTTANTQFYVNGNYIGTTNNGLNPSITGVNLTLGTSNPAATAEFFKGEIDEVRVWNTARTAAQISANKSTAIANPASTAGLVAYYPIDQNATAATLLPNYSANTLSGRLYNYPVAPTITSLAPGRNYVSAARNSNVAVTFSAAMDASSPAALRVFGSQTGQRAGTGSGGGTSTLVFDPIKDLKAGETASLTVTTVAKSQAGLALAKPSVSQFTGAATSGTATFAAADNEVLPSEYRNAGAVADLNGDGNLDLVQLTTGTNPAGGPTAGVSIRLGDGTGQLAAPAANATVTTGDAPDNVTLGDIDGDGDVDMLVSKGGNGPYPMLVFKNDGNAVFTPAANGTINSGGFNRSMTLGDIDGDGDLDLVTTNGDYLYVFGNNGSGTFTQLGSYSTGASFQPVYNAVENVTLADVDNDGDLDALATVRNAGVVGVRLNNGAGTFSGSTNITVGTYARSLAVADVDGDGDLDFVTANSNATAPLSLRLNDGSGNFTAPATEPALPANSYGYSVKLGDLDGDGDADLAVTASGTYALLNNGAGTFARPATGGVIANDLSNLWLADFNNDGALDVASMDYTFIKTYLNRQAPAITSFAATSGPVGAQVVVTGVNFADASSVKFNGVAATSFTVNSATQLTVTVPAGATTGAISVATPAGTATSGQSFTVVMPQDVVISNTQTLDGTYRNVTITGTGKLTLTGTLDVTGTLTVQNGGLLNIKDYLVTGSSFVLADGGTLSIGSVGGISASGNTGGIRTATRAFASDASYVYGSYQPGGETGSGLPAQVRSLSVVDLFGDDLAYLKLTNDLAITQVLRLDYDLATNGKALTLRSTPTAGSALVHNNGGVVVGTATVQRAIDPTLNSGLGYRQFSAPVGNTTVADLATSGFAPVVNPAYNTSATPTAETPFPTVYSYDQSRLALANNLGAFDKGWVSPASLTETLTVGKGYTVNLPASEVVDFVGTLNNGTLNVPLSRAADATAPDAGWQLLGNPYPAPLDLSLVDPTDRANLDAAVYVSQSLGQYSTQYRSYVNGFSTGAANSPIVPTGQGFFVRVSAGQTSGSFTFRNSQRQTTFDATTTLQRPTAADPRPQVHLALRGAGAASDAAIVYFETGATAGLDAQYDAAKLPNTTGLNLSTASATGQALAIDGRALPTGALTIALNVYVPTTGTYTLHADQLLNLNGLRPYLRDLQLGTLTDLAQQPSYSFSQNAAFLGARFELVLTPAQPLATTAASQAQVAVYPNPARTVAYVELPAALGTQPVAATLLDNLGRAVRTATLAAQGAQAHQFGLAGLPSGVYTLRLRTSAGVVAKRLVIE